MENQNLFYKGLHNFHTMDIFQHAVCSLYYIIGLGLYVASGFFILKNAAYALKAKGKQIP